MSNINEASQIIAEAVGDIMLTDVAAKALADAGLLTPDLPAPHAIEGDLSHVNRVEVIAVGDTNARKFVTRDASHVRMDVQDYGRTLKIFYRHENEQQPHHSDLAHSLLTAVNHAEGEKNDSNHQK